MKKYISLFYKFIMVILSILGVLIQIGIFSDELKLTNLNYYTLISNMLCSIYFIIDIVFNIKYFKKKDIYTFNPMIKSIITMGITVTMLVVIFLLPDTFPTTGLVGFSFIVLHYIVPIMVIGDWLTFDVKGRFKKYYPFTNLILPIVYYIYVIILVMSGYRFLENNKFPYDFQNIDVLGLPKIIIINICITVFIIILGYIYYFIDHKLSKKS